MYEPTWSQPLTDWQPTPSFRDTAVPPAAGPTSGTLVQLPCINQDWLPLVLGAVDQLRNPATWLDTLSDAARDAVLGQVDYLRSLISEALNVPCCSYQLRFTSSCVLQFSTDSGVTWTDVSGWDANFAACVSGVTIPGVPENPGSNPPATQGCNIAGYLAKEIIQLVVTKAVSDFNASKTLLQFGQDVMDVIGYAFPITFYAFTVFHDLYNAITAGNIADFTSASTDPVLWGDVTCAIYNAIKTTGYITSTNLATVIGNVCAISYSHPDVVTAICNFITNIGLQNLQKMQSVAVVDNVDCSGCVAGWCVHFNFSVAQGGWSSISGLGNWVGGVGWESAATGGVWEALYLNTNALDPGGTITSVRVVWNAANTVTNPSVRRVEASGSFATNFSDDAAGPIDETLPWNHTVGNFQTVLYSDFNGLGSILTDIYVHGTGTNSFASRLGPGVTLC